MVSTSGQDCLKDTLWLFYYHLSSFIDALEAIYDILI